MSKKNKLQPGMLVSMHRNREKHRVCNDIGMVVNSDIGLCIVDNVGHSISVDVFDDNLRSFFYNIDTVYGFAPPHEANKFNLDNRHEIEL